MGRFSTLQCPEGRYIAHIGLVKLVNLGYLRRFCNCPFSICAVLEKQLAKIQRERDDLAKDVEFLCAQSNSSIFDSSMVLSERVYSAEKELSKLKGQVSKIAVEEMILSISPPVVLRPAWLPGLIVV